MFSMNRYSVLALLILSILTFAKAEQQQPNNANGVLIVSEETLSLALQQNNHLILYFSQDDCKYCQQFLQIYTLVSKLHAGVARFSKINLTPQTQQLYTHYQIKSTPTVLAFENNKLFEYRYQPIGSGNTLSVHFFKWVERLYHQLKHWEQEQNNAHQLIVHCNSAELIQFWKDVQRSQLWLDVYCGTQEFLKQNLVIVHEYGRRVQGWQLQNNSFKQFQPKIRRLIEAYKYKYVIHWNTAVIQQIFTYNVSAFVLLINNESLSHQTYKFYQNIKKKWYENSYNYEPTIFAVSDLSLKTYQTLKLKHYLTGFEPYSLKEYYYPILAFIHRGETPAKYVLSLTAQKTEAVFDQFINKVNSQLIKGNSDANNNYLLERWLSQQKDINQLPSRVEHDPQTNAQHQGEGLFKIGLQHDWNRLLSLEYQEAFFVYITWRFDYKMQTLQRQLNQWWKSSSNEVAPHYKRYKFYLHLPHVIDLPNHPDLSYQYLPTLFFISISKKITKFEGVTDLSKIKAIINEIHLKQAKNY